jgi:glycosyltransferase involved in cell wall biosynthesis
MKSDARVLFLTKYGRSGASSRYRVLQYLPYLESHGFQCDVQSLHGDEYGAAFFARREKRFPYYLGRIARRTAAVLGASRYSAVFIQKELVPYAPPVLEFILRAMRARIIYDIDDAIFLLYGESKRVWVQRMLGGKIPAALRWSSAVLAGNAFLHAYALAHNPHAILFPTVVDHAKYRVKSYAGVPGELREGQDSLPVIGWIGSPETVGYLLERTDLLRRVAARYPFELRVIGAPQAAVPGIVVRAIPWDERTEAAEIARCDIGIMPLPDSPWAKGKCGLKLLQYMAAGLPVVSSPDGGADTIVQHGVQGFVARSDEEWYSYLLTLLDNPGLRARMGSAGRSRVEEHFSLEQWAPRMADVLRACIRGERAEGVRR